MSSRAVDAGQVVGYFQRGFEIIKPNILMLALAVFVILVIAGVLSAIPMLGQIAGPAVGAIFGAGILLLVRDSQAGRPFDFARLFAAFQNQEMLINLLIVAAPSMAIGLLSWLLVKMNLGLLVIPLLLVTLLYGLVTMFAVPRVVFGGVPGVQAITESLNALGKNIVPVLLFVVFVIIACLAGVLALLIGIFFVLPIIYAAQMLFTDEVFGHASAATPIGGPMAPPPPPAPGWK